MLQEARARMVDVETGVEPRPMRTIEEEPPGPPASRVSVGRAVKRPSAKPAPVAVSPAPPQAEDSTQDVLLPESESDSESARSRTAGPDASAAMLGNDEVLWLEDKADPTLPERGNGSTGTAPWRRGLRG
jgi:hypothetical protein